MKASCTTSVCLHKKPSPQARRKDIRNEMYHYFCGQTVRCRTSDRSTSLSVHARGAKVPSDQQLCFEHKQVHWVFRMKPVGGLLHGTRYGRKDVIGVTADQTK